MKNQLAPLMMMMSCSLSSVFSLLSCTRHDLGAVCQVSTHHPSREAFPHALIKALQRIASKSADLPVLA